MNDEDAIRWAIEERHTSRPGNSGLGFTIVTECVCQMGGTVEIRSGNCRLTGNGSRNGWSITRVPPFVGTHISLLRSGESVILRCASPKDLMLHVLDVPRLIDSRILMGEFRGHALREEIRSRLRVLSTSDALLIDMFHAFSLDYYFSEQAFAPVFNEADLMECGRQVLFGVAQPSRNAFFEGILRSVGQATRSYSGCQAAFVEAHHYCKVLGDEHGPIQFVGDLANGHTRVLDAVNQMRNGTVETIGASVPAMETEDVLDALRALADRGFVLSRQIEWPSVLRFLLPFSLGAGESK